MRVMALFSTSCFAKYLRVGEDGPGRGHLSYWHISSLINFSKSLSGIPSECQFGYKSDPMFCRTWSGSKLFAKVVSRQQKSPLVGKELKPETKFVAVDIHFSSKMSLLTFNVNCLSIIHINKNQNGCIWKQRIHKRAKIGFIQSLRMQQLKFVKLNFLWKSYNLGLND